MSINKILAVDDELPSLNAIKRTMRRDFDVILAQNGPAAIEVLRSEQIAVILADQRMPQITGVDFFQEALKIQPDAVRILITGYTDIDATIDAINRAQIYYYINKPWEPEELLLIVKRGVELYHLTIENRRLMEDLKQANKKLREENILLHREAEKQYEFENIVGQSDAIQEVFRLMRKVIPTETTVLITGETGTGKELIARAIHYNGPRKEKLFIAQNCAALPDTLLESELFGHVKGAFTGAVGDKKGLFERADGGTIFLDEISDTSPALQQRLLRVLQGNEIHPVGSEKLIKVDVRIISATNKDLQLEMKSGKFREDLFYRLNVFPIHLPPLRNRQEDIPQLARHFLKKYRSKLGKSVPDIDQSALKLLMTASFPGNIRELENEIERAVALAENGQRITPALLSGNLEKTPNHIQSAINNKGDLKEIIESVEKMLILKNLKNNKGNITQTAQNLGLSRVGLQKKIKRYGLDVKKFK